MRKLVLVFGVLAAAMTIGLSSASAITDGVPDGNGHPYVGLMVAQDSNGVPQFRCSGTLLSSRVFLTAGHCTDGVAHVEIWFDQCPIPRGNWAGGSCNGKKGYPCSGDTGGTPHAHPLYDPNAFFLHDAGVVVLRKAWRTETYGQLPSANQLDALQNGQVFTAVGYGLQAAYPDPASFLTSAIRERLVASPKLLQINTGFTGDFSMLLSNNANTGGTCFGDSGGPNFLDASNVVAGVTSFGLNPTCGGTGGVFRMDRQNVLDFVNGYLS